MRMRCLSEAKTKAKNTIEEAEMISRQMLDEMEERLKIMGQQYKTWNCIVIIYFLI